MYGQMIFIEAAKTYLSVKNSLFNKWYGETWILTYKRIKLNPHLTLYTTINSKCIKNLNTKIKHYKTLRQNYRGQSLRQWIWQ